MDTIDKRATPSLARIKGRAKLKAKTGDVRLSEAQQLAAQDAGFPTYRAARQAKQAFSAVSVAGATQATEDSLAPAPEFMPCHWAVIGSHYWYLEVGELGPELWRRPRGGLAAVRVSQLGIFQALCRDVVKDADGREVVAWSIARYGTYNHQALEPWTDKDAEALTAHFGLPVVHDVYLPGQKELSEELFLRSRAFAALRRSIRAGGLRPAFGAWNYGLTNVWNLLVALPDEVFQDMGQEVVVALFDQDKLGESPTLVPVWRRVSAALEAAWSEFKFDDAELQEQIASLLPPKLARRMRAHLVESATG